MNTSGNDFECPICSEEYDFEIHVPKLIPCGNHHIICMKCVQSLIFKNKPKCPFDQSKISQNIEHYKTYSITRNQATLNHSGKHCFIHFFEQNLGS